MTGPGRMRSSIQIATPSSITPNTAFTASIHAPALAAAAAGGGADDQQRRAHAQAEREQRAAAAHHVAALADDRERGEQRRRDAGRDDQRRQRAHHRGADQRALPLLVAEVGEPDWSADGSCRLKTPNMREREQHEQAGEDRR